VKILNYSTDVCSEMLKFDFIVHPSRFESFGYVPVEAMSVKVPVIVSHEGGLKEVVDESSGYISHDNSPLSYLTIIEKIFRGDVKLPEKIEYGYARVQNLFSKKTMIFNIEKIYL
jgi:glycosyltransferase involved in cell wall biosynthesis